MSLLRLQLAVVVEMPREIVDGTEQSKAEY
jgi:hypothetical protein